MNKSNPALIASLLRFGPSPGAAREAARERAAGTASSILALAISSVSANASSFNSTILQHKMFDSANREGKRVHVLGQELAMCSN